MAVALELLAPARDASIARQAILHGADAVYIGGPSHGARAAASNSVDDIASLTAFAHLFGAKVYVTLNTIIYEHELPQVRQTVNDLYHAGVDALIVQDMALLRLDLPPIGLHASTQCDIRTPQKAVFLSRAGFSQLVLPREFSLSQIRDVREAVTPDVRLEAFVHGALCVSYSGDCQASHIAKGRSANRGECAQMCRLPYTLTDGRGNVVVKDKHLLSLRDLCRIASLERLADAGITSFKIEGRLKDAAYVKNTVGAYRQAIDAIISRRPDDYCRASYGSVSLTFTPDLDKTFNRGYTSYFINGRAAADTQMANLDTPKFVGERVATVVRCDARTVIVRADVPLANGDGLGFFSRDGQFDGFRLNRVEGNVLYPATKVTVPRGTVLYRNRDMRTDAALAQDTARRLISVDASLNYSDGVMSLCLTAENGITYTASTPVAASGANTPQKQQRQKAVSKLGDTHFALRSLSDSIPDNLFIPASVLTALRRDAASGLEAAIIASYQREMRRKEDTSAAAPAQRLTYHDNVANSLAEAFYADHGAQAAERAVEVQRPDGDITVMTTRYCLRRQLGACLLQKGTKELIPPLRISNASASYRLDFDCHNCQMHVIAEARKS